eukprot:10932752-Karenia_brevis.AAC.1
MHAKFQFGDSGQGGTTLIKLAGSETVQLPTDEESKTQISEDFVSSSATSKTQISDFFVSWERCEDACPSRAVVPTGRPRARNTDCLLVGICNLYKARERTTSDASADWQDSAQVGGGCRFLVELELRGAVLGGGRKGGEVYFS